MERCISLILKKKFCKYCKLSKLLRFFYKRKDSCYSSACRSCHYQQTKKYQLMYKKFFRELARDRHASLRQEVLAAYGSCCVCCGENIVEFLTIDHIDNEGASYRRNVPASKLYRRLKRNKSPKDNFQLLCYNCNCAKGRLGQCPHANN